MQRIFAFAILAFLIAPTTGIDTAHAGWSKTKGKHAGSHRRDYGRYNAPRSKRRGAQVRGFTRRGGHYSYTANDVINTYGDSRTTYGGVNSYRDPFSDRQTVAGPFDHGWFFDSGVAPRGGDSPYMQ